MKFKDVLNELDLKKNKWTSVSFSSLDNETKQRLWEMYQKTYAKIGLHIESKEKLTSKYKVSWLIDIDKDPQIDAFIIYKDSPKAKKISLLGSDGRKESKAKLIKKMISLLKKKGWVIGASHKVAEIIKSNGVPVITNPDIIKSIDDKFIDMEPDGEYRRSLAGIGIIKKYMFGKIK